MGTRPREAWRPDVEAAEAASQLPPAYRSLTGWGGGVDTRGRKRKHYLCGPTRTPSVIL